VVTKAIPTLTLANGVVMPAVGFGTAGIGWPDRVNEESETAVIAAVRAGYRLIDTAKNYENESGVGRGIRASGVDRDEILVVTKFDKLGHGEAEVRQECTHSAERLGLERIDLLLIHWPNPQVNRYVDAWRGMIGLLEEGKVRAIGVSNFKPAHLDRLAEETGVTPHVNQIQLDPTHSRGEERRYHAKHGIVTQSWSPLGTGGGLLDKPTIVDLARSREKTPAQIVLRWNVQLGLIPIPRTSRPTRMQENLGVFDFELTEEEMDQLAALDGQGDPVIDSDQYGE
jgi:2,5-diketo-D-gluconate reductase A